MMLVRIGSHTMDAKKVAELIRIIREIPANKRAQVLDELKRPEYYTEPKKGFADGITMADAVRQGIL